MDDSNNTTPNEATPLLTEQVKDTTTIDERDDAITSTTPDTKFSETMEDAVFFGAAELGISSVSPEKITENVDDIAQDLENLLDRSTEFKALTDHQNGRPLQADESTSTTEFDGSLQVTVGDKQDTHDLPETNDKLMFKTSDDSSSSQMNSIDAAEIQINEVSTDGTATPSTLNNSEADEIKVLPDNSALTHKLNTASETRHENGVDNNIEATPTPADITETSGEAKAAEVSEMSDVNQPTTSSATEIDDTITTTYENAGHSLDSHSDICDVPTESVEDSNVSESSSIVKSTEEKNNTDEVCVSESSNTNTVEVNNAEESCDSSRILIDGATELDAEIQSTSVVHDLTTETPPNTGYDDSVCNINIVESPSESSVTFGEINEHCSEENTNTVVINQLTESVAEGIEKNPENDQCNETIHNDTTSEINSEALTTENENQDTIVIPQHVHGETGFDTVSEGKSEDNEYNLSVDIGNQNELVMPDLEAENKMEDIAEVSSKADVDLHPDGDAFVTVESVENSTTVDEIINIGASPSAFDNNPHSLSDIKEASHIEETDENTEFHSASDSVITTEANLKNTEGIDDTAPLEPSLVEIEPLNITTTMEQLHETTSTIIQDSVDVEETPQSDDAENKEVLQFNNDDIDETNSVQNDINNAADVIMETQVSAISTTPEELNESVEPTEIPISVRTDDSSPEMVDSSKEDVSDSKVASDIQTIQSNECNDIQNITTGQFEFPNSIGDLQIVGVNLSEDSSSDSEDAALEVALETSPHTPSCITQTDLETSSNNLSCNIDSNSSSSSTFPYRKEDATPTSVYNVCDDESAVTTTEVDVAVNSIMSPEQIHQHETIQLICSSNTAKFSQPNLVTESASAVEALISAELSDTAVHSNTVEYDISFASLPQYKPTFMPSVIPTPKSFEPSVIELNSAVASILGESSNTTMAELEYTIASVNAVSTSSVVDQAFELNVEETVSFDADLAENVQSSVASGDVQSNTSFDFQGSSKDISEQLVTQSNIDDTPQDVEAELGISDTSVPYNADQSVLPPAELGQLLSVDVEVNDYTEHTDSNVSSTQVERSEPVREILSPESQKNLSSLKITIGKDDSLHSILKIYDPNEAQSCKDETVVPKITIKPIPSPVELQQSPKFTIKPIKSPEHSSPKITIKPILKPEPISPLKITLRTSKTTPISPKSQTKLLEPGEILHHSPKITIKPIIKPDEHSDEVGINNDSFELEKQGSKTRTKSTDEFRDVSEEKRNSPKLIIKPIIKPPEEEELPIGPRITIKPIIKPLEETRTEEIPKITIKTIVKAPEECHSPKITIKPIVKPEEPEEKHTPRITIKPVIRPSENEHSSKLHGNFKEHSHDPGSVQPLKLNIKNVFKPEEVAASSYVASSPVIKSQSECVPTLQSILNSSRLYDRLNEPNSDLCSVQPLKLNIKPVCKPPETNILQSFLKSGELPQKSVELVDFEDQIKQERIILKISKPGRRGRPPLSQARRVNPLKLRLGRGSPLQMPSKRSFSGDNEQNQKHLKGDMMQEVSDLPNFYTSVEDESISQTSNIQQEEFPDPLSEIPVFEITPLTSITSGSTVEENPDMVQTVASIVVAPIPKKRGRPRKVPLQVREEFKDPTEEEEEPQLEFPTEEELLRPKRTCRGPSARSGVKPRRARSSRGRRGGSSRGSRAKPRKSKELRLPLGSLGLFPEPMITDYDRTDVEFKPVPLPTELGNGIREVVIYEEETRMSAENSSRAQTPAKQVLSTDVIEESQSSVQSNATTESGEKIPKSRKGARGEVFQEPEGEVLSADKLAEYSWGGGGPYMLQEQVAQFLGIKSFKRKYPGIHRRTVDMQERDFIRESCLASEAMCDMGLTAVKSEDILDIMYTDFQHKYEEYCKFQRDRQAKDVSNKQKALSLAATQEKNKLDIVEQAVQSAQQWNANFNKTRREQRRACMDLQTFTVHYPKGKMKQINKPPIGNYPLSLVPGQYSDYYKKYTPHELTNLPLNTVGCGSNVELDSQSDGSGSDSDSSSSDTDSSSSGSSEDCKVCNTRPAITKKQLVR